MKFKRYEYHLEIHKPISSVRDKIFNVITNYPENKISNINKSNDNTWFFNFTFLKSRWYHYNHWFFEGKVYSKDDSVTYIDIQLNPKYFEIPLLLFIVLMIGGLKRNIIVWILKGIAMIGIIVFHMYMYINNNYAPKAFDKFWRKLDLE